MKAFPIKYPLAGEQVVAVQPELNSFDAKDWRRRLNNFTGRALTHTALHAEQLGRSGRIVSLGQLLSPGVVNGLVVDKGVSLTGEAEQKEFVTISTGSGLTASGEIVSLNFPLQVEVKRLPVYAPVSDLALMPDSNASAATDKNVEDTDVPGEMLVRKLGPELQTVINAELDMPRVAVLVLQPVQVEMNLQQGNDPCELDAENYAYENWQLVDGARLVLYSWPEEVISLPGQPTDSDWRNKIANAIFSYEKNLPAGDLLPWMNLGVAIGVIGFDEHWHTLFVDNHSVVRSGGKRRRSASVLTDIGNRFIWQARFQQFNEQLAEFLTSTDIASVENEQDSITQLASLAADQFRYLPPVGVLPKDFINLQSKKQNFFPLSYHVEAIAVPYEQLDVVIQDSAALAVYDFNRADSVQALIPVPQAYFETDILATKVIDMEFDFTIARFVDSRNDWLGRRLELRRKASAINKAIRGEAIDFTDSDEAIDDAELATPFENALIDFSENWHYLKAEAALANNWQTAGFDDSSWSLGNSGFGYGLADNLTELDDMQGNYLSIACRKIFKLNELDETKHYRLEVLTSDGFIAYLNGKEIKRHNLSGSQFNAVAGKKTEHTVHRFELGNLSGNLQPGENVLAFQAHNSDIFAQSFSFSPRLITIQFVDNIEDDDYAITVNTDDDEKPLLDNFEPVYSLQILQNLKQYFESKKYLTDDDTEKLIWSTEEIEKFNRVTNEGLEGFIEFIQDKVNKANDKVDFGFVRLQTDIYRIRQFMLGNVAATKLATSPVLAGIAKGETATATKQDISKIASLLSQQEKAKATTGTSTGGETDSAASAGSTPVLRAFEFSSTDILSDEFSFSSNKVISGTRESVADSITTAAKTRDDKFDSATKDNIISNAVSSGSLLNRKTSLVDIEEQSSIVGSYPTFRNVTVGERLNRSTSEEAIDSGRSSKAETIGNILSSGLSMDGIKVPGIKGADNADIDFNFSDIDSSVLGAIRSGVHDPADFDDESSKFNASIRSMENASSVLRLTEGRIKTYRMLMQECKKAMSAFYSTRKLLDRRLKVIADELAESRHDVSVSRALKNEEIERIEAINARRQAILDEHVPYLVFRRPRLSDVLMNAPVHDLQPDLSKAPLPVCDVDEAETPEEISAMMDVLTDAPIKWYKLSDKLLNHINRVTDLYTLLKSAKLRASTKTSRHRLLNTKYDGLNKLALGINKSLLASHKLVLQQRNFTAAINLQEINRFGWLGGRKQAKESISLGDAIDGSHGRKGASKQASEELEKISKVSVCLYLHFSQVLPSLRLDWAERLSQYDAALNLRNLYSLPRWGEIDFIERNEMQKLVDYLFDRINTSYGDASSMINDLIRICILLSSHAPVNKLIAGHLAEPGTLQVGRKINIIANLARVRVGMNMAVVLNRKTVAQGTVVDIVGGHVVTQVTSMLTNKLLVEKNTKVQLGEPRNMGGIKYSQKPGLFGRK